MVLRNGLGVLLLQTRLAQPLALLKP
jgi:hypothetical protein